MKKSLRQRCLVAGLALLVVFVAVAALVALGCTEKVDRAIVIGIHKFRGNHNEPRGVFYWLNRCFTELGYIYVLIPSCVLAFFLGKGSARTLLLSLGTGATWLVNNGIKSIFTRERPDAMYRMMAESSTSFPSGHAMNSAFFFLLLAYVIHSSQIKRQWRKPLTVCAIVLPFVIGITRINLTVHYLSDVVAGWLMGGALTCLAVAWCERLQTKKSLD